MLNCSMPNLVGLHPVVWAPNLGQTDRQTDRQKDRQTDKFLCIRRYNLFIIRYNLSVARCSGVTDGWLAQNATRGGARNRKSGWKEQEQTLFKGLRH